MPPGRLTRLATAVALVALLLAAASLGGAGAATVIYRDLVLHANAGFEPEALPHRSFAPIEFSGEVDLGSRSGGAPPTLTEAVIDFDRDGRLEVAGLPACAAATVAALGTAEARATCRDAIVGEGEVEVAIAGSRVAAPLTIFNGPEEAGHPTAVLHARLGAPVDQVFAVPAAIETIPGLYRYRVTIPVPPLAAGRASLTRIEARVGRRFRFGGKRRSYVSARCSNHLLHARGRFAFADGTAVEGSVEKYCRYR